MLDVDLICSWMYNIFIIVSRFILYIGGIGIIALLLILCIMALVLGLDCFINYLFEYGYFTSKKNKKKKKQVLNEGKK